VEIQIMDTLAPLVIQKYLKLRVEGKNHPTDMNKTNPLDVQIAGDHYKKYEIQPIEFCHKNKLPPCETAVIKYVCRHKEKNGIEDLKKAIHYLELLIELDYNKKG